MHEKSFITRPLHGFRINVNNNLHPFLATNESSRVAGLQMDLPLQLKLVTIILFISLHKLRQTQDSSLLRFIPKRCDCSAPNSHERDLILPVEKKKNSTLVILFRAKAKERMMQWRIKVGAHWDIDYVAGVARIHLTKYSIEIGVTSPTTPRSLTN